MNHKIDYKDEMLKAYWKEWSAIFMKKQTGGQEWATKEERVWQTCNKISQRSYRNVSNVVGILGKDLTRTVESAW